MDKITVVTGFSHKGYEQYGKNFLETFHRFAPEDFDLVAYVEKAVPTPRGRCVLNKDLRGVHEFRERNKHNLASHGREPTHGWRHKDERIGYSYRFDAQKFCWQLFYPEDAAASLPDDHILVWFDGDIIFHGSVSRQFILRSLANADLAYLGRTTHSELGFWAVRLNTSTRAFLRAMPDLYRSDRVFSLREWHSAFVFDHCLSISSVKANNLTPNDKGNVWERTPLKEFSTHLKGRLKGNPF
ncbi:MAG TPA: hypothetical protein VIY48_16345 [Candidatus Paceibacterota bacterium]